MRSRGVKNDQNDYIILVVYGVPNTSCEDKIRSGYFPPNFSGSKAGGMTT